MVGRVVIWAVGKEANGNGKRRNGEENEALGRDS